VRCRARSTVALGNCSEQEFHCQYCEEESLPPPKVVSSYLSIPFQHDVDFDWLMQLTRLRREILEDG